MKLTITKDINDANLITHAGTFHADDVFATAFLTKIIDNPVLYRINNYSNDIKTDAIVYDIGGGEFDHHQINAKVREENFKYSSIGLLFEKFGEKYIRTLVDDNIEEIVCEIDKNLIKQIDAIDNGIFPYIECEYNVTLLSDIISLFNPTWDDKTDRDELFLNAVKLAEFIFDREVNKIISKIKARDKVIEAIKENDGSILYLEEFMPFKDFILESTNPKALDIKFVIFPSIRGGFTVHTVPTSKLIRDPRLRFPVSISGLRDEELRNKTGIKTATFVHADGFIGAAETLEDAFLLANYALYN
jgi:uncharacterized UPF0160 family protein